MTDYIVPGMFFGGLLIGLCWLLYNIGSEATNKKPAAKLERDYIDTEAAVLQGYLKTKKGVDLMKVRKTWEMQRGGQFQRRLEEELINDFFGKKKE